MQDLGHGHRHRHGAQPIPANQPSDLKDTMPLSDLLTGQEAVLAEVHAGRGLQHRLAEMGLRVGVRFRVLSRGRKGPFILSMQDTRLMLGQGMAHCVMARVINKD